MFQSEAAYDSFMGRFSVRLAPVFADFAGVGGGGRVLDVGAGTGALADELLRRGADVAVAEPSAGFVAALQRRFPGVESRETAAEDLPWADETFDSALAQLVVSFMNDAPAGVREMHRVVRPGGTVAVCMWDIERMELLAAVDRTRDALGHPREAGRYRTRAEMAELMGLDAEIELLEVEGLYSDFEDFWTALAGGAGPAGAWAASLQDGDREAARAELYRQLGEPDGPFDLTGRAWAARVTRA